MNLLTASARLSERLLLSVQPPPNHQVPLAAGAAKIVPALVPIAKTPSTPLTVPAVRH